MKFKCQKCAWCCKNFGKLGWLPVYDWEKDKLEEEANERGINLTFVPVDLIIDKRTNISICFQFGMKNEPCPFLDEKDECSIYDSRPLICKAYPLAKEVLLRDPPRFDLSSFGHCPNLDAKELLITEFGIKEGEETKTKKSEIVKKYLDIFGYDMVIAMETMGMLQHLADFQMKSFVENRVVKLRKISKFDYHKYFPIGIFAFFKKISEDNDSSFDETMDKVLSGDFVREQIEELIKE